MNALQIVTIPISVVVAGEAAALAVGMHLVKKSQNPWISLKNDLLLALDVVVGLALIMIAYLGEQLTQPVWFPIFVMIGLLTHLFRVWEYLAKRANAFCGNRALWIVNNLKFSGLLLILVWGWLI
jgi:hypothetical protein